MARKTGSQVLRRGTGADFGAENGRSSHWDERHFRRCELRGRDGEAYGWLATCAALGHEHVWVGCGHGAHTAELYVCWRDTMNFSEIDPRPSAHRPTS